MIFNMGGTAPRKKTSAVGKYAWRKYAVGDVLKEMTSTVKTKYVVDPDPENYMVYASASMETDKVNGIYTLVSPREWTMTPDGNGLSMSVNNYIMFGSPSGSVVFKNTAYSDYRASVRATSAEGTLIVPGGESYPVTKYSFEMVPEYVIEEIVVSDDPEEYPEGELDGFIYERMNVNKGVIELDNFDATGVARKVTYNVPDAYTEQMSLFIDGSGTSGYKMIIFNADEVVIRSKKISASMFGFVFYKFSGKLKIFSEHIGQRPFEYLGYTNGTPTVVNRKVFISKDVLTIEASSSMVDALFYNGNSQYEIYCEAESKPSGWGTYWNYYSSSGRLTVHWGVTEEEFDAL